MNSCANDKIMQRFAGFYSLVTIALTPMIIFGKFEWSQRYSNAPGNLTWPFLFLGFGWTDSFKGAFIAIGLLLLGLSLATFGVHMVPSLRGMNSSTKKMIKV